MHKGIAALLFLLASSAGAGEIVIEQAWLRAVPPVADSTAGYFHLTNNSERTLVLEGAETDLARHAMIHETVDNDDGTRGMHHLERIEIPPGETLVLRPGGKHLMLSGLRRKLDPGQPVEVCLLISGERHCRDFPVRRR